MLCLDCFIRRLDAPDLIERIQCSHPTRDVDHLRTLLRPRLEQVNMGFGIEEMSLRATRTARLSHQQAHQWTRRIGAHQHVADAAAQQEIGRLLDTLTSRFGATHVLGMSPTASHVPEHGFCLIPRGQSASLCFDGCVNSSDAMVGEPVLARRPGQLLSRPERVEVIARRPDGMPAAFCWRGLTCEVRGTKGPERIGAPWWRVHEGEGGDTAQAVAVRDYFTVVDHLGRWFWMFRRRASAIWWMHGQWG